MSHGADPARKTRTNDIAGSNNTESNPIARIMIGVTFLKHITGMKMGRAG
jgi:hypothetical protein